MKNKVALMLLVGLLIGGMIAHAEDTTKAAAWTLDIGNFTLKNAKGKNVSFSDFSDKKAVAVVFMGTECPINNYYTRTLNALQNEYADKGVQIIGINSNDQDSAEDVSAHVKEHRIEFPVLKDDGQRIADLFGAERTPETFLIDPSGKVLYHGRIDDQYGVGYQRLEPKRKDLAIAIDEYLSGKPISLSRTEVPGCIIGRMKKQLAQNHSITYTNQVARIMQKYCQECHRPGQIGPFSLMTYENAVAWADTVHERVADDFMPPWHADPRFGKFSNNRSMAPEDKNALLTWIEEGCPKGDPDDMPPPRTFIGDDGWRIGRPDVVIDIGRDFKVPANSPFGWGIPYQYFRVKTNFKKDMWLKAAEARPGAAAVVHHILVYVREESHKNRNGFGPDLLGDDPRLGTFLVGTAPGDMPAIYGHDVGKKIPKGAELIFQVHYTPNGVEQLDRSSLGLIFAEKPPRFVERTRTVMNGDFLFGRTRIAAADNNFEMKSTIGEEFTKDAMVVGYMPHMHLRGKSFEYKLIYPDGKEKILLWVPEFDFGWQSAYRLAEPLFVPAGSRIVCTAHFDNSDENPNNPDSSKPVRWGDQTWDEMMIGWLDYYYLDEAVSKEKQAAR